MSRTRSPIAFLVVALLGPALWSTPLTAQVAVSEWLVLGPMPAPAASVEGDAALEDNMLSFEGRWPMAGDRVSWFDGRSYRWERQRAREGTLRLNRRDRSVAFALAYLSTDR